jgi:hypothetical protein
MLTYERTDRHMKRTNMLNIGKVISEGKVVPVLNQLSTTP